MLQVLLLSFYSLFLCTVQADMYLQSVRGSNNRLDDTNRERSNNRLDNTNWERSSNNRLDAANRDRNNGNRLFDSQNGGWGGSELQVGGPPRFDLTRIESEVGDYYSPLIGYHVIGSAISTESGSVDDCMGMCDANADCTAFSYMKYSNQCRLEGSYFSGHIKRNWRSDLYRKRGAESEVGMPTGPSFESEVGDYRSPMIGYHVIGSAISTESGSVDDCMGMCDANADCTAFSYMKYSNQCRLEGSYFSGHIKRNWRSDLYRKRGAEAEVGSVNQESPALVNERLLKTNQALLQTLQKLTVADD